MTGITGMHLYSQLFGFLGMKVPRVTEMKCCRAESLSGQGFPVGAGDPICKRRKKRILEGVGMRICSRRHLELEGGLHLEGEIEKEVVTVRLTSECVRNHSRRVDPLYCFCLQGQHSWWALEDDSVAILEQSVLREGSTLTQLSDHTTGRSHVRFWLGVC